MQTVVFWLCYKRQSFIKHFTTELLAYLIESYTMFTLAEPCSNNTYTLTVHVVASLILMKTDENSSILFLLQKEVIHENISQLSNRHIY